MTGDNPFGEPIYTYTRAQAIDDGELIDVSETAKEAGIKFPVAVTRAVWGKYVEVPKADDGTPYAQIAACQSESGRLWDIVWMFRYAIRKQGGSNHDLLFFKLHVAMPDRGDWASNESVPERGSDLSRESHRLVTLKALCHPGDDAEPVITIMMPDED